MLADIKLFVGFILAFAIGEIIAWFVFYFVRKALAPTGTYFDFIVLKGMIERLLLTIGFIASIPTVIVFFGAIKLGTRLSETAKEKVSNDYFLIGNVTSGIIAIFEYLIYIFISKHF